MPILTINKAMNTFLFPIINFCESILLNPKITKLSNKEKIHSFRKKNGNADS